MSLLIFTNKDKYLCQLIYPKKYVKKWGQVIPYPDQKKSQVFQYPLYMRPSYWKYLWDFVKKFLTYFKILNFISMFWRKTNRPQPILKKSRTIWSKFLTNQNIDFFFFRKTNRPILLKGQSFFSNLNIEYFSGKLTDHYQFLKRPKLLTNLNIEYVFRKLIDQYLKRPKF